MKRMIFAAAALAVAALATSAPAAVVGYGGTLNASPTFARPVSLTALSAVGTAVGYTTLPFTVSATGDYSITLIATTYDPFLLLYSPGFNPAAPLTNLINGDDDFDPDGAGTLLTTNGSRIVTGDTSNFAPTNTLTAGVQYVLVSTSFSNGASGSFVGYVDGPGTANFNLPEPASLALLGVGGLALARRRR